MTSSSSINESDDHDDRADNAASCFFIKVSETLPSLQDCYEFCNDPCCGAVTSFVGTTRNTFQNMSVTKLTYEGYVPMAEKELFKLCQQACVLYPTIQKIAAVHILGDCPVGQPSVILACSSPHRKDALLCIEYLIDTLKATIPIWKQEWYQGDNCMWKENIEWKEGKAHRVMIQAAAAAPITDTPNINSQSNDNHKME